MSEQAILPARADLANCSQEPIHIPGAIQPHGVLFSLEEPGWRVSQASANTAAILGLDAQSLLGRDFTTLLGPGEAPRLVVALQKENPAHDAPLRVTIDGRPYDAVPHRHAGALIVELEPAPPAAESFARHHRLLQKYIEQMRQATQLPALFDVIVQAVSELTGYERVMLYRFDADWHGEVLGEALTGPVDSYLGHHFPASDIPEQARALYARSWLRIIPTVDYTPAQLVPPLNPREGRPLDLSFAVLRSVSPIHMEYLRNMEVGASMSISVIVRDKLWGLIACHHRTARPLPFAALAACELLGQIASREIDGQQERQRLSEQAEVNTIQTRFFDLISQEENVTEALARYTPSLLEFMGARGAAICLGGQISLVGETPTRELVRSLLAWLREREATEPVYATDALSLQWAAGRECAAVASGLLAVKLSRVEPNFVLWFRPEVLTTVTWAGNPNKPVEPGLRMHPRKSFAAWKQVVSGHSTPWKEAEIRGAYELRLALNALVIRRTDRLLKLNSELEQKNSDLNSFAYIASHDLREPLRGIHQFARFIREDEAERLSPEGLRKVETIATLAAQTDELLTALGQFSQIGRMELTRREVSLDTVVDESLLALAHQLQVTPAEIRRPRPLPMASCDPVLIREVYTNLIGNALRYNDKPERWVEISCRDAEGEQQGQSPIYTVQDNGIGIRERNLAAVFQMFRRLSREKFGPGTGAGLAIVKSIVERHGGKAWVESTFGAGSTFCFTLR